MWDERFSDSIYVYGCEPSQFLVEQMQLLGNQSRRVLTLGEGEGRNGVYLARLGHEVHAVDGSVAGQSKALNLAEAQHVSLDYSVADLADYQFEGQYDLMVMIFCHLPLAIRTKVHQQMCEHLAPGGVIIYQAYSPWQLQLGTGGPKKREMLVELSELEQDFSALNFMTCRQLQKKIVEGIYHTGMADVVEMVAQRPLLH
ncbi:class I SAM-dependent methyltransferase [Celerinatantimonas diazotrophica]|uniref:Methyltransferase family protein n=1 Tax=Celerinatantimonas diazotrophica TaxID=412034 RepID=A0A4R1J7H1_9GAMM|nr:class I SAM-dependent methyltransferase [Celerinatantimonas diazotrophica]TCK46442.1 methyltransferase family protein [Celerinatantimonas diazotrophica]CAG9295181.1 hypothetical protein CEDIAZO_00293 [Celerinatantimonas diazotrophica]